jgi:hypothetical protein
MSPSAMFRAAALAVVAAGFLTTAAPAQAPAVTHPRADVLFQRAEAMGTQPTTAFARQWRRMADLYVKSAELRAYGDPRKVESLRRAGGLLMRVDPGRSRELLERAGDAALAVENLFQAASLYTDAAWVVVNHSTGAPEEVQAALDCLELARHLAEGPSISREQRAAILHRIKGAAAIVAAHGTSTT